MAPGKLADKSYDDLVKVQQDHFSLAPLEIVQRFNLCVRKPGELVAIFLANLRAASEHCNYGDSLELMLQDCLVYGIMAKPCERSCCQKQRSHTRM